MKRWLLIFSLFLSLPVFAQTTGSDGLDALYEEFKCPPAKARPMVWYHLMNGNITKEGMRKDIMWMDSVGIKGFHIFDVKRDTTVVLKNRLLYMTPEWNDAFNYALNLADSLGMEVGIPSSPGWSVTGGPWVEPEDAMKKIVWRELPVKGGTKFNGPLPPPFTVPGQYQNMKIHTGGDKRDYRWYEDLAVIAVKMPDNYKSMQDMGAELIANFGGLTLESMTDGDVGTVFTVPTGGAERWAGYKFSEPQTIRSLTLFRSHKRIRFGSLPQRCLDSLQISDDGKNWRTVMGIPMGNLQCQTISFEPVTAQYFRVKFYHAKKTRISEMVLYPYLRVNHAEEKAAYAAPHDLKDNPTLQAGPADVCPEIIDITSRYKKGVLNWKVPKGNWMIYRFGASLTGKRNHPAPPEATGLEIDKLDVDVLRRYMADYIAIYQKATGNRIGDKGLQYMMVDSYEAELSNWTPKIREEFRKRMGYDMYMWLPAVTGLIIGSTDQTEKFLWDLRTVLGELFTEAVSSIPEIISEYGFKGAYMEGHENCRGFVADGIAMKKGATFPMAAGWMQGGNWDRVREARADIRESAAVANIYGRELVCSESFAINGNNKGSGYGYCPANIVGQANEMLAAGVNRVIIHESAHQPLDDKRPGLGLGPYGQWFNRHETWGYKAGPWLDYLARNCALLQKGRTVNEILYFYGEDCCVTGMFQYTDPDVPHGYGFDYVNSDILINELQLKGNTLVAPATGMTYRLLVLHKDFTEVMSLKVLRRIAEIARSGVHVCGNLPQSPASLMDSQQEFDALLNELRALDNVHEDVHAEKVVSRAGIVKDFDGPQFHYIHRTCPAAEIYFVINPSEEKVATEVSFNCYGRKPEIWYPKTGERAGVTYRMENGRTVIDFEIEGHEGLMVVFGEPTDVKTQTVARASYQEFATVAQPWNVTFQENMGVDHDITLEQLRSLTLSMDPQVRYFSGTATYTTSVTLEKVPHKVVMDLGKVGDMASVRINGKDAGFAWKSPFIYDVSGLLREGENTIEVEVTNRWANRVIGEIPKPKKERLTFTVMDFYKPNAPLFPSGLMGPVKLFEVR